MTHALVTLLDCAVISCVSEAVNVAEMGCLHPVEEADDPSTIIEEGRLERFQRFECARFYCVNDVPGDWAASVHASLRRHSAPLMSLGSV